MEKLSVGFIGCGSMAIEHKDALGELYNAGCRDFRVISVCDIVESKAEFMADEFEKITGFRPTVYTDSDKMLSSEKELQSVLVITPHSNHHTLAMAAMNAGVNVMVEKPIGFTIRVAKDMMECANKTGKLLHVAENYRMDLSERAIKWAVSSGMIGTPRMLTWLDIGERKWYWNWRDHIDIAGGAWTLDGGVHHSDLFQLNLGPVNKVWAVSRAYETTRYAKYKNLDDYEQARRENRYAYFRKTRSLKQIDPLTMEEPVTATVEDTTCALLEFESGVVGTWTVSRAAPGKIDRSNVIYGSEGALYWYDGIYNASGDQIYTREGLAEAFLKAITAEEKEILFPYGVRNSLSIEWKQHFDALNGIRPVEVNAEVGLMAMAVPMAIYESATIGAPVLMKDVLDLKVEVYQAKLNEIIGV